MKLIPLFALFLSQLPAQPPADPTPRDVQNFLHDAAEDLSNKDSRGFLDHFDPKMPGYEMLHYEVEGLVARDSVVSTIEIVTDKAADDNRQRTMELDWILIVDSDPSQRKVVKITIERQGKKWKIVALDPVEFFKPKAAP